MASRLGAFTLGLRRYATAVAGEAHHEGGMKRWKLLTFFVAIPGISLCYYNAFIVGEEHARPDYIEYEHLRRRTKALHGSQYYWFEEDPGNVKMNLVPGLQTLATPLHQCTDSFVQPAKGGISLAKDYPLFAGKSDKGIRNALSEPFPWGDGNHSLFHNAQVNAVPGVGYEEEMEHHH